MLNHGTTYVIYAPYIQRIINYTVDMEFENDGKHGAYQPHIIWGPVDPPPHVATAGTSVAAPASHPARAPSPPPVVSRPTPSAAPESSRVTTCRGKK
jgi:hypothetical protein